MARGKLLVPVVAIIAVLAAGCGSSSSANSATGSKAKTPTITLAAPECASCLGMDLLGDKIAGYQVKFESFGTLTDLTAGLASGRIDVGQIDYTGLASFVSKGLPIVAISGEVNGGSDFVISPKLGVQAGDWAALKVIVTKDKAAGHPLKIASQFGSVQDIEMRLELPNYGINPNTDVDFVNVPYQGMAQALRNGSAQAAVPVQPFAAEITLNGYGDHFSYPYNQAAGDLANVVVVTKSFLASHPTVVAAIARGMSKLVPYLSSTSGKAAWAKVVEKYTSLNAKEVDAALGQLTPDIDMPFNQIRAFATAMYNQKLIASPLSTASLNAHIDYQPLAKALGRSSVSLGAS